MNLCSFILMPYSPEHYTKQHNMCLCSVGFYKTNYKYEPLSVLDNSNYKLYYDKTIIIPPPMVQQPVLGQDYFVIAAALSH